MKRWIKTTVLTVVLAGTAMAGVVAGLGKCEVKSCTCTKYVDNGKLFGFCKTCKHRDYDHKF